MWLLVSSRAIIFQARDFSFGVRLSCCFCRSTPTGRPQDIYTSPPQQPLLACSRPALSAPQYCSSPVSCSVQEPSRPPNHSPLPSPPRLPQVPRSYTVVFVNRRLPDSDSARALSLIHSHSVTQLATKVRRSSHRTECKAHINAYMQAAEVLRHGP